MKSRKNAPKQLGKRYWKQAVLVFVVLLLIFSAVPLWAYGQSRSKVFTTTSVPNRDVAIVFGAGLEAPGKPSSFLESRLLTALQLYKAGKVKVVVVSGDNRQLNYDEPTAMRHYLMKKGMPADKVIADYAGFNTYATCYRAHAIFGINRAILVTHGYHLPRAIMTCQARGVQSIGVAADRSPRYSKNYWAREILSLNKAALEIMLQTKPDVLGKQESSVWRALQ